MKIENLKYFEEVCNLKNFTEVAEINFTSQSSISKYISETEKFFDVKLLERERFSKQFKITSDGEKVLKFCEKINKKIERTMSSIAGPKKSLRVNFGFCPLTGTHLLKPCLVALFKEEVMKEYSIELYKEPVEKLREKIINQTLDFAMTCYLYNIPKDKNINILELGKINFEIFFSIKYIKKIDEKSLNNKIFISLKRGTIHYELIQHIIRKLEIKPKKIIYVNTFELLQELLDDGVGISILGKGCCLTNNNIKSVPIDEKFILKICLEYYRYRELSLIDKKILLLMKEKSNNMIKK